MPANDSESGSRQRLVWIAFGVFVVGGAGLLFFLFRPPPQMGADADVFKTVDALYTAVRMKDEAKLSQCETRLHGYREAGKLPKAAADHLDGVIAKARGGGWQSAAERLYEFMLAQRREGAKTASG
jgi:hypothetical protein